MYFCEEKANKNEIMKKEYLYIRTLIVSMMLLMTCHGTCLAQEDLDAKYATELIAAGSTASDFTLTTPEGKKMSLSDFKGSYVVIDFWASWCPDCLRDIPMVKTLYEKHHAEGVEFLGVSFDTDIQRWRDAIAKHGITYPQCSELKKMRESDVAKVYGLKWIPSLVVVSPDGKVLLSTVMSEKVGTLLDSIKVSSEHR